MVLARKALAANIRRISKRRRVSLNALADLSDVSRSQLFAVLAGTSSPSLDWLARVADGLGVEPFELLRARR